VPTETPSFEWPVAEKSAMIQMGQGLESGSSCLYNADDQKD
jgi:hypothetical protein